MTTNTIKRKPGAFIGSFFAVLITIGVFYVVFRNLDIDRLTGVLLKVDGIWLVALAISIPLEQILRGWKWRQILFDIRPVGTFRLFGAVMAGYFANMIVPVGVSPFVRAWLVARLEGLKISTVLLTTAIERFVDGIVFAILVGILIAFATLPASEGNLRLGMITAGGGSFLLFSGLFVVLFAFKKHLFDTTSMVGRSFARLEQAFGGKLSGLGNGMAQGITWPKSHGRGAGVILASIGMKVISTTHFLWAGLAIGILLAPFEYLFIMVFSGFALIISRFIRLPGGGVIGSALALKLLGIADEEALTMVLLVHTASLSLTAGIGIIALWKSGLTVMTLGQDLSRQGAEAHE
jgi:glycosyltransferase 2 family protein